MSSEPEDGAARSKAERGRMTVLSLMALYLVLAVAIGAVRSQISVSHSGAPGVFSAQTPYR